MSADTIPADGSIIEMTSDGKTVAEVRVVRTTGEVMLLSMAPAHGPPVESTVELRWALPPRGRCSQRARVLTTDDSRVEVRFDGAPSIVQARSYVRGGGHFTDVAIKAGDGMVLRIRVGEEEVAFPATALTVDSMRQQIPRKGPMSVEMVVLFDEEDEAQSRIIRRHIMRHQMQERQRGLMV